jgi:hypothetical protein
MVCEICLDDLMLNLLHDIRDICFPFIGSSLSTFTELFICEIRLRNVLHNTNRRFSYTACYNHYYY